MIADIPADRAPCAAELAELDHEFRKLRRLIELARKFGFDRLSALLDEGLRRYVHSPAPIIVMAAARPSEEIPAGEAPCAAELAELIVKYAETFDITETEACARVGRQVDLIIERARHMAGE